jgi:hypothetical protein
MNSIKGKKTKNVDNDYSGGRKYYTKLFDNQNNYKFGDQKAEKIFGLAKGYNSTGLVKEHF